MPLQKRSSKLEMYNIYLRNGREKKMRELNQAVVTDQGDECYYPSDGDSATRSEAKDSRSSTTD